MIGEIEFYQTPSKGYRRSFEIGQFFLAPVPFLFNNSRGHRLKVDYYDEAKPSNSSYTIELTDIKRFDPKSEEPIYELKLSSDDFILCVPHKFRPVILLSETIPGWKDYGTTWGDFFLLTPIYSVKDTAGNYKFSTKFLLHAQAYEYPSLFYLPESTEHGVTESLARFDRILIANPGLLKPLPIKLSEDAIICITDWFRFFAGAKLDELLLTYRELALQELEEND